MAGRTRKSVLELDAGAGSMPGLAMAATTPLADFEAKETNREGLAELDRMTEASNRLTRAQKDRERIIPRDASGPANAATKMRVPEFDEIRTPVSGRQMKARSKLKRATQRRWTRAQYRAVQEATSSATSWQQLTDHLSAAQGDTDLLPARALQSVQRIDRSIRQYEERNDRQHLVYANVQLPEGFDASKLENYPAVHLDRWTAGTHNLHELSEAGQTDDNTYVIELATRRGMYFGQSEGGSTTEHLLPRGMSFTVEKVYEARWKGPDGHTGTRRVIRLQEIHQEG